MKLISVEEKSNWQTKSSAIRFDSRQKLSEIASKAFGVIALSPSNDSAKH